MVIIDKWRILIFHKDDKFHQKVVNLVGNITASGKGFEVIQVDSIKEARALSDKKYEIPIILMSLERDSLEKKLELVKCI
jgi:hypothetical protein